MEKDGHVIESEFLYQLGSVLSTCDRRRILRQSETVSPFVEITLRRSKGTGVVEPFMVIKSSNKTLSSQTPTLKQKFLRVKSLRKNEKVKRFTNDFFCLKTNWRDTFYQNVQNKNDTECTDLKEKFI